MTEEEMVEKKVREIIQANDVTGVVILRLDDEFISAMERRSWSETFPSSGVINISNGKIKVEGVWYDLVDVDKIEVRKLQKVKAILLHFY
ncbi:hypothetical protein OAT16_04300 [Prolixibacteraceae bacterium]|nr:hypothetical protein [Prolixibacteraceae bacterium]